MSAAPSATPMPPLTAGSDDEPFELRGPAALGSALRPDRKTDEAHPVRARLLERAKKSNPTRAESAPRDGAPPAATAALPLVSHHLSDDSSAELVRRGAPGEEADPHGDLAQSAEAPGAVEPTPRPSEEFTTAPPPEITEELERFARSTGRTSQSSGSPPLSPNVHALLWTLLGVSLIFTGALFVDRLRPELEPPPDGGEPPAEAKAPPEDVPAPVRQKIEGPARLTAMAGPGQRVISGKFGREPFLRAVEKAGLPRSEAYRAFAALKDARNLDRCGPHDSFKALVAGPNKRLMAFEYIVGPEEVYQASTDSTGRLRGKKLDLKVERNQIRRALVVQGGFEESARKSGFDPGLGGVVERALSGHLALSELRRGDRMRIVAQEVTVLGEFARYSGIEAIELARADKPNERFYYYSHPVEGGYFDAGGRAPWEGGFRKPVPGAPITSKFNLKRLNPVLKKVMPHTGTDFGAPIGTPILATKSGKITFSGWGGPNGNFVRIAHDGGFESGYSHLSRFVEGLKVGDPVERLQPIGYVGSTGRSTGPHLHFHIKKNGEYVDPESLNLDGKRILPQDHREPFAAVRAKYDPILEAIPWPEPVEPEPVLVTAHAPEIVSDEDTELPQELALEESRSSPQPAQASLGKESSNEPKRPVPAASEPPRPQAASPSASRSAIFLTDAELQRSQPLTNEGEVD